MKHQSPTLRKILIYQDKFSLAGENLRALFQAIIESESNEFQHDRLEIALQSFDLDFEACIDKIERFKKRERGQR